MRFCESPSLNFYDGPNCEIPSKMALPLTVEAGRGNQFHFEPGMSTASFGMEIPVFEHSTDRKGMDRDLVFIFYEPDAAS